MKPTQHLELGTTALGQRVTFRDHGIWITQTVVRLEGTCTGTGRILVFANGLKRPEVHCYYPPLEVPQEVDRADRHIIVQRPTEQWHRFDRDGDEERRLENRERRRERIATIPRLPNGQLWPAPEYDDYGEDSFP